MAVSEQPSDKYTQLTNTFTVKGSYIHPYFTCCMVFSGKATIALIDIKTYLHERRYCNFFQKLEGAYKILMLTGGREWIGLVSSLSQDRIRRRVRVNAAMELRVAKAEDHFMSS